MTNKKTIVFAGGGHAHIYSLRRTRELVDAGYDVVLINPSRFLYYSGMAPGLLSRIYRPEEDRIDVRYLVEKGGGRFVKAWIAEIRSESQEVLLDTGETIHYDVMTTCLGSGVPDKNFADSAAHLTPVKPVENMERLHWRLRELAAAPESRVLVIGGGPAGVEMASNALSVLRDHGARSAQVTLANAQDVLIKSAPARAQRLCLEHLTQRGIDVQLRTRITQVEEGLAHTDDGRSFAFDVGILAVGIAPPSIFRDSGLATGPDGGLWINEYLQSVSDPRVFGGGDSVAFQGQALTRLGVFAIRQGPVIFENLRAYLEGRPMRAFEPQELFLYILNLGDLEGLTIWGRTIWKGKSAWAFKDLIDRRFMETFQYPEDEEGEVQAYFDRLTPADVADVGTGISGPGALRAATGGTLTTPDSTPTPTTAIA